MGGPFEEHGGVHEKLGYLWEAIAESVLKKEIDGLIVESIVFEFGHCWCCFGLHLQFPALIGRLQSSRRETAIRQRSRLRSAPSASLPEVVGVLRFYRQYVALPGGVPTERIQFNENSLWTGDESDTGYYQNFGDLFIDLGHDSYTDYRRALNLSEAIHRVSYCEGNRIFYRETFSSNPGGIMVLRLTSDHAKSHTGTVRLLDAHNCHGLPGSM
jgi:hypothetical protein